MQTRIQEENHLLCGLWVVLCQRDRRRPRRTTPDFAGVVGVVECIPLWVVYVRQTRRAHHLAVAEFGHGRIPATVDSRGLSLKPIPLMRGIVNRSIRQTKERQQSAALTNGAKHAVGFSSATQKHATVLHDRHAVAEVV